MKTSSREVGRLPGEARVDHGGPWRPGEARVEVGRLPGRTMEAMDDHGGQRGEVGRPERRMEARRGQPPI